MNRHTGRFAPRLEFDKCHILSSYPNHVCVCNYEVTGTGWYSILVPHLPTCVPPSMVKRNKDVATQLCRQFSDLDHIAAIDSTNRMPCVLPVVPMNNNLSWVILSIVEILDYNVAISRLLAIVRLLECLDVEIF